MKPHLQRDDFFGAVDESSTAIIGVLGDTGVAAKPRPVKGETSIWTFLLAVGLLCFFPVLVIWASIKDAREKGRRRALGKETDADLLSFSAGGDSSFSDDSGSSGDSGGGDWGGGGDTGGGGAGDSY